MILIADLGATNARFCITEDKRTYKHQSKYLINEFDSLDELCFEYLNELDIGPVEKAIIGVAAPVQGDQVSFVNTDLKFSIQALKKNIFPKGLLVVNDLELQGHALFNLKFEDLIYIAGTGLKDGTKILVAPGTGLGLSGIIGKSVIATEAGHINIANSATKSQIKDIVDAFAKEKGRQPNYEDFLSGKGIKFFHECLSGISDNFLSSEEILSRRDDQYCYETIKLISFLLSSYLRYMALVWGAAGGVLISGSIVSSLLKEEDFGEFRREFVNSETMQGFLSEVPLAVVNVKEIGFLGGIELSKKLN